MMFGVLDSITVETRTVALDRYDVVVFYTDGISAARSHGELLGDEDGEGLLRDCAGLSPSAVAERLGDAVVSFSAVPCLGRRRPRCTQGAAPLI